MYLPIVEVDPSVIAENQHKSRTIDRVVVMVAEVDLDSMVVRNYIFVVALGMS